MKCSVFKLAFLVLIFSSSVELFCDTLHEVQKGETLYSISKKYGVSVSDVQNANGLSDNGIKVGQKIKIPDGKPAPVSSSVTHEVQKGETWFGISKKYGISVDELQKFNDFGKDSTLKVGQKLKVPSSSATASSDVTGVKTNTSNSSSKKDIAQSSISSSKIPEIDNPRTYSGKKADSSLVWPVKTENIVYINGKVGGVSMAAKKDEEVKAIRAGTVMFSGSYRGFGNVVFIQSKTGHIYAYTGLGSIDVSKGDYINYSSEIGTAGIDTYTGKSQISLMVFQNGQPIDPAKAPRG
ncbi:LysM peptidoglycan-binding domain-containing protein [Treponema sp.]|uniref:LysM peptidoglycan-binding domain-containing protein n=1 Tax=Treponema sp. TaxID=166 RepID=UPI00388E4D0C